MNKLLASQIKKTIANTKGLTKTQKRLLEDVEYTYDKYVNTIEELKKTKPDDIHKLIEKNHTLQVKIDAKNKALKEFKALSDEIIPKDSGVGALLSGDEQLDYIVNYLKWLKNEKKRAFNDLSTSKITTDIILDNWKDGILILDKNKKIVKTNQSFLSLFGLESAPPTGKNCIEMGPLFSDESKQLITQYFFRLIKGKSSSTLEIEEEIKTKKVYLKISGAAIKIKNEVFGAMFVIEDITTQKEIETVLMRRKQIIEAINQASTEFLVATDWEKKIERVLKIIGKASDVSRVYIFQNYKSGDKLLIRQLYEWASANVKAQISNEELQAVDYKKDGFKRWLELLPNNQTIANIVSKMPKEEQDVLLPQDIKSVLIVPIFVDKHWWGFIGFDECRVEREWTTLEIDSLMTFSHLIGVAIQSTNVAVEIAQTNKTLEDKNNKLKQVNRLMIGREIKMIELKKQIVQLKR